MVSRSASDLRSLDFLGFRLARFVVRRTFAVIGFFDFMVWLGHFLFLFIFCEDITVAADGVASKG